jgi:hypothetical protein
MTATAWAHLPNAVLIDRVVATMTQRPKVGDAAWAATWDAAWDAAQKAARKAAWDSARGTVLEAAWRAAHGPAHGPAWDAVVALIAWDDAGPLLDTPMPALRLYAANGSHAAILILPAAAALGDNS